MMKSELAPPLIWYTLDILSVEPLSGSLGGGQIITVTGFGFSDNKFNNAVTFVNENRNER